MTHEEWLESTLWTDWNTENAWIAAQQAERERILEIIKAVSVRGNHDQWFDACDRIMEAIDV